MHKLIRRNVAIAVVLTALSSTLGASQAVAQGNTIEISIADALAKPEMQDRLRDSVKFFFGNSPHPDVAHTFKRYTTNKRARAEGNSIQGPCEQALLSALLQFQSRALRIGADAVTDIHSYYRHQEVSSDTSIQCHDEIRKVQVVLIGNFVKLAAH